MLFFLGAAEPGLDCAAQTKDEERPNIVLIMADDMGFECVRANGGESYETPHLDALAKNGVRFSRAHSQPICTPTRVQIMSGLYNSRNYTAFGHMAPDITTFGNMLQDAGYATCIVGKWQLDGGYSGPTNFGFEGPGKYGFDEYCLWQLTRRAGNKPNRFANPGFEINGEIKDYKDGQYGPDILTDYAGDFIKRQAEADKPFLLYYPMLLPHWPFEPTPDSEAWDPAFRQSDPTEKRYPTDMKPKYFADMVAYTDKMVAKILKQLEDAGVRDNTLVIFTGDNGTESRITSVLNGKSYKGGKGSTTRNGTHVPLIVDWPGLAKQGAVIDDLIDFTDMLPTMLDAAGVSVPENFKPDGRSFLPQVRGEAGDPRQWVYCWFKSSGKEKNAREFAMNKDYKLYTNGRLFDLRSDPDEESLIRENDWTPEQAKAASELLSVIEEHTRK